MEIIERERDNLERAKEKLTVDLAETLKNMNHYRSSCQSLTKEIQDANEAFYELQTRYESAIKNNTEKAIKRMESGLSIDSIDGEYDEENTNIKNQVNKEIIKSNEEVDTLENELNEFNELEGFDENNHFKDDICDNQDNSYNSQNELEEFEDNKLNEINEDNNQEENVDSQNKLMTESEIQTDKIQISNCKIQTEKNIYL